MEIANQQFKVKSLILRSHVSKYAFLGLLISICSIIVATILVALQHHGYISLANLIHAQRTNPAIWALDLTPFMFAYWGQSFCYGLASTAEEILEETTRELENQRGDLKLKLQYESNHDHLTNLPNHRLLTTRINQGLKQVGEGEQLALILIGINDFKDINYKYGNFSGNSLLLQFAEKLKTLLLEPYLLQAYMGMNMVARVRGAEFALLIPRLRKEHNLELIITAILDATSLGFTIDGNNIQIKTTAGVTFGPQESHEADILIQQASISLLYAEKRKIPFVIYEPSIVPNFKESLIKVQELEKSIENDLLVLLYEPEVDLIQGKMIGAEVGLRYESSAEEVLDTEKLLSAFEASHLIKPLNNFILNKALQDLGNLHQQNKKMAFTINILDLTDPDLPNYVEGLLEKYSVPANFVKLAVTENTCLRDQSQSLEILNRFVNLGIQIIISDFCSGYSSFTYLINFPISEIKIDKSIVAQMGEDEKKVKIVHAVINMAEPLGVRVFAEGINNEKVLNQLKKLGCRYGQGDFLSPPLHFGELPSKFLD